MAAPRKRRRYLPPILLGVCITLIGAGTYAVMRNFLNSPPGTPQKVIQEIHLIRPPPPPPDLPPPPPPEEKVDIKEPEQRPEPTPSNEPPPGEQLGLDADGSAGGDAFGLLANRGGRDLLAAGGGSAYVWYAGLLKDQVLEQLNTEKQAHRGQYAVVVRVWVRSDGTIDRVSIVEGSGNRDRDSAIESALSRIKRLAQAPPADMPEPINLRIVSRG